MKKIDFSKLTKGLMDWSERLSVSYDAAAMQPTVCKDEYGPVNLAVPLEAVVLPSEPPPTGYMTSDGVCRLAQEANVVGFKLDFSILDLDESSQAASSGYGAGAFDDPIHQG